MTGNGKHTTDKNGIIRREVKLFVVSCAGMPVLAGGLEHLDFPIILGMLSSQLTHSFQRGSYTTNQSNLLF